MTYPPAQKSETRKRLNEFLASLPTPIEDLSDNLTRISIFIYFLTVKEGEGVALKIDIGSLFELADLNRPANLDRDLQKMRTSSKLLYHDQGYRLHRKEMVRIDALLQERKRTVELKKNLFDLSKKIKNQYEREFIEEAIRCFGSRPPSKRATVIMTWIACMDHLQNFLLTNKKALKKFNAAPSKIKAKAIKVAKKEDFAEFDEAPMLLWLRETKIVDKNVSKQLGQNLDFRNSCAHPNNLVISEAKVESFVEDIIQNVLLKYK